MQVYLFVLYGLLVDVVGDADRRNCFRPIVSMDHMWLRISVASLNVQNCKPLSAFQDILSRRIE